jgi:hypothetical protein
MYIVQTCMYMFIQVHACFNLYRHVHMMYKHVHKCLLPISCLHTCMSKYVQLMFRVQMATYSLSNVQTLLNGVCTLMYPFRCSFLICPAARRIEEADPFRLPSPLTRPLFPHSLLRPPSLLRLLPLPLPLPLSLSLTSRPLLAGL